MSSVEKDYLKLSKRLTLIGSANIGNLFVSDLFCETTQNIILSVTGKSGTVISLSREDIKKVIEILEVM